MADLFNIGLSGLRAAQAHLSVTGQNITNVNTPGYSRQTAIQSATQPSYTGAGYLGNGTRVSDVQRIYNEFLTNQVRNTTSSTAQVKTFNLQIEELNSTLSSKASGITSGMQNYFDALQTAIEDPAGLPGRQLFLSEAQGLAGRFNSMHEQLSTQNRFLGEQMSTISQQVTRLAQSVASYNEAIAKAAANGSMPNDLLDARDEAVRQLSEYVGVTVVRQDDSSINLFIGSGQPLVVGKDASILKAVPGRSDPSRMEIQLVSGGSAQDVTKLVSGGQLGGLLSYREDVLDLAFNALGRMSLSLASEFNQQLAKGLDLNGNVGSNLFADINSDEYLDLRSRGREGNQSQATVDVRISDTSQLSTSDYELSFTSATEFTVRRLDDNRVLGPFDLSITDPEAKGYPAFDGLDLSAQRPPSDYSVGDSYLLTPTRSAAQGLSVVMTDPRQLAFAAPMVSNASLQNRGSGSVTQPVLIKSDPTSTTVPLADLAGMVGEEGVQFTYAFDADIGEGTLTLTADPGPFSPTTAISIPSPGAAQEIKWEVGGHTFSMTLSGTPLHGDTFTVKFNESGVADNRNALALSGLQSQKVLGQADGARGFSLADGYGDLVQRVATSTAQSRTEAEASQAMLAQATNHRNSVSAVNLDEEAANLIQFEQFYNASAQIIQIARSVFDTLISSMR